MATDERVLVVILSWNDRRSTEACVDSVLAMEHPSFDVLVVDNASRDDTVAALEARFGARIQLHCNRDNLLYAGGMNIGLRRALQDGYAYVVLLNNDVVVDPALLRELTAAAAIDPTIAAVGPKIYYTEPPDRLWFAGGQLSLWRGWPRHRGIREPDRGQYDRVLDVDYLTGACLLVRTEALQQIGYLDTGFAMYAEDAEWCFRARAAGYRLVFVPAARMWHAVSAAAGAGSWFKIRRRAASQWRFLRRHARWYHWLVIPAGTLLEFLRVTWGLVRRRYAAADKKRPQA